MWKGFRLSTIVTRISIVKSRLESSDLNYILQSKISNLKYKLFDLDQMIKMRVTAYMHGL